MTVNGSGRLGYTPLQWQLTGSLYTTFPSGWPTDSNRSRVKEKSINQQIIREARCVEVGNECGWRVRGYVNTSISYNQDGGQNVF